MVGARQIQTRSARLDRQNEDRRSVGVGLEGSHHLVPLLRHHTAVQERHRNLELRPEVLHQQVAHLTILREDQRVVALRDHLLEHLRQTGQFAGATGQLALPLLEVVVGVVADLLERRQQRQDVAPALEPARTADARHRHVDGRLVERCLLPRERAVDLVLLLLGQVLDDVRVGLETPQHKGAHHLLERLAGLGIAEPLDGHGELATELTQAAEQAGVGELEDGPELGQPVLDRRAGERDAMVGGNRPHRHRLLCHRVLDVLRLVHHQVGPLLGAEQLGIHAGHHIGGQHHCGALAEPLELRRRTGPRATMVARDTEPRRKPPQLMLPVAQHRGRTDEQRRWAIAARLGPVMEQQRDDLDGLAQAHVVGEAGAKARLRGLREPGKATLLVGTELANEAGRSIHKGARLAVAKRVDERLDVAARHHIDDPLVGRKLAGQRHRDGRRTVHRPGVLLAVKEVLHHRELGGVYRQPLATPLHQRLLHRRDLAELLCGQLVIAHGHLPLEGNHRIHAHLGGAPVPPLLHVAHLELQLEPLLPLVAELLGHPHRGTELRQHRAGLREELPGLFGRQHHAARAALMQRSPDGAEDPRALAQRDEQALVRLHKPLVADHHLEGCRLPDRAGVDAAARVLIRLQHEAEEPGVARPVGLCRHPRHLEVVGHRVAVARRAARTHRRRPAGEFRSQRLLDEARGLHHGIDRGQTVPPAELPRRELAVVFAGPVLGGRGHRLAAHRVGSSIEEGPQQRLRLPDGRHRRDRLPPPPPAVAPLLPLARRIVRLTIVHHHRMARQRQRPLQHRQPLARRGAQHRHAPARHQLALVAGLDQRNHLARRDHLYRQLRRHRPDAHRVRHLALRRLCQVHPNQRPDGLIHRQPDAPDLRNLPVFRLVPLRRRDDQIGLLRPLLRLAPTH